MKITNEIKKTAAQLFATSVKENVLFMFYSVILRWNYAKNNNP